MLSLRNQHDLSALIDPCQQHTRGVQLKVEKVRITLPHHKEFKAAIPIYRIIGFDICSTRRRFAAKKADMQRILLPYRLRPGVWPVSALFPGEMMYQRARRRPKSVICAPKKWADI
jgi:hypothetical protein